MKKKILFGTLAIILFASTISIGFQMAEAQTLRVGGTIQSTKDLGKGHESHQLAIILPPNNKIYKGTLYYYASEPIQLVTLKGPLTADDKGKTIWTTDLKTKYELILEEGSHAGKWNFEGNAIAVHTMRTIPFTISYTVQYTESVIEKMVEQKAEKPLKEPKDAVAKDASKSPLTVQGKFVKVLNIIETSTPGMHTVIFQVCGGKELLRTPEVVISSDVVSRSVNLANPIQPDTCYKTLTTVRADSQNTIKAQIVDHSNIAKVVVDLEKKMDDIKKQIDGIQKEMNSLSNTDESLSQNKQKISDLASKMRDLRQQLSDVRAEYYKILYERYGR